MSDSGLDNRNPRGYNRKNMIKTFKHKGLEDFFYNGTKKGIRPEHARKIGLILDRLNAAADIIDMNFPGSYLHKLSGDLEGQYSVRVSGNWRIHFEFIDGDAYVVNYTDYH
jgi:proteic killer suppression protein